MRKKGVHRRTNKNKIRKKSEKRDRNRNSNRKDSIIVIRIEKIVPFFSNSSNPMHGSHG